MDYLIDFIGRNLDVGAYVAGTGLFGFVLKSLVEKFVSQKAVDAWFDGLRESFFVFLNGITPAVLAVVENAGIFLTKLMSGKIGSAIWNNTFEVLLIWFVEGILGMVIVFINWLASLPGKIVQAFLLGLRSDNKDYTPLNSSGNKLKK